MKGRNVLKLNTATVQAAIERYLHEVVLRERLQVLSVAPSWENGESTPVYVVELDEAPEPKVEIEPGRIGPLGLPLVTDGGAQTILSPPVTYEVRS